MSNLDKARERLVEALYSSIQNSSDVVSRLEEFIDECIDSKLERTNAQPK